MFYKTSKEEQETIINIIYSKKELSIYTSRKSVYERIKRKLGDPNKIYYTQRKITGVRWNIPLKDKKRVKIVLSRPNIIGQIA